MEDKIQSVTESIRKLADITDAISEGSVFQAIYALRTVDDQFDAKKIETLHGEIQRLLSAYHMSADRFNKLSDYLLLVEKRLKYINQKPSSW